MAKPMGPVVHVEAITADDVEKALAAQACKSAIVQWCVTRVKAGEAIGETLFACINALASQNAQFMAMLERKAMLEPPAPIIVSGSSGAHEWGGDDSALKAGLADARVKMHAWGEKELLSIDRGDIVALPHGAELKTLIPHGRLKASIGFEYDPASGTVRVGPAYSSARHAHELLETMGGTPVDQWREKKANHFNWFCFTMLPHVFSKPIVAGAERMMAVHDALHDKRLIVVPMERGEGKTSLAMAAVVWAALHHQNNVVAFASEAASANLRDKTLDCWCKKIEIPSFRAWRSIKDGMLGMRPRPQFVVVDDPIGREAAASPSERQKRIKTLACDVPHLGGGSQAAGVLFGPLELCRELVVAGPWTFLHEEPADPIAASIIGKVAEIDRVPRGDIVDTDEAIKEMLREMP